MCLCVAERSDAGRTDHYIVGRRDVRERGRRGDVGREPLRRDSSVREWQDREEHATRVRAAMDQQMVRIGRHRSGTVAVLVYLVVASARAAVAVHFDVAVPFDDAVRFVVAVAVAAAEARLAVRGVRVRRVFGGVPDEGRDENAHATVGGLR